LGAGLGFLTPSRNDSDNRPTDNTAYEFITFD
jgi:hypothetical protein